MYKGTVVSDNKDIGVAWCSDRLLYQTQYSLTIWMQLDVLAWSRGNCNNTTGIGA